MSSQTEFSFEMLSINRYHPTSTKPMLRCYSLGLGELSTSVGFRGHISTLWSGAGEGEGWDVLELGDGHQPNARVYKDSILKVIWPFHIQGLLTLKMGLRWLFPWGGVLPMGRFVGSRLTAVENQTPDLEDDLTQMTYLWTLYGQCNTASSSWSIYVRILELHMYRTWLIANLPHTKSNFESFPLGIPGMIQDYRNRFF